MPARFEYEAGKISRGYNMRTLHIDLGANLITSKPVSEEMKEKFIGGKGFDLWLLWNSLPFDRIPAWDDPMNEVCIACGPLGGNTFYPGSGKSIAMTISPLTGSVVDSNVGGYFGPYLKFSGWDALEVQGKAASDVVIVIDGDRRCVTIDKAPEGMSRETHLIGESLTHKLGGDNPRCVSVVSAGTAAEHTLIGCLNFSWYDAQRKVVRFKQAGRGGIGTVFRDKKILAIAARKSYAAPRWKIDSGPR